MISRHVRMDMLILAIIKTGILDKDTFSLHDGIQEANFRK